MRERVPPRARRPSGCTQRESPRSRLRSAHALLLLPLLVAERDWQRDGAGSQTARRTAFETPITTSKWPAAPWTLFQTGSCLPGSRCAPHDARWPTPTGTFANSAPPRRTRRCCSIRLRRSTRLPKITFNAHSTSFLAAAGGTWFGGSEVLLLLAEYKVAKNAWRVIRRVTPNVDREIPRGTPAFLITLRHALSAVGHVRALDLPDESPDQGEDRASGGTPSDSDRFTLTSWSADVLDRLFRAACVDILQLSF